MGENIFKKSNELDELAKNKVIERNKLELKVEKLKLHYLLTNRLKRLEVKLYFILN